MKKYTLDEVYTADMTAFQRERYNRVADEFEKLFGEKPVLDAEGRIRLDDLELQDDIQEEVTKLWSDISTEKIAECADIDGYWEEFYKLFGFKVTGVDYDAETDVEVKIDSID